jgi:hypothetical protein
MFNQQQFEDKVYELVTREVNAFFSSKEFAQSEIINVQRQILHSLHFVIEETMAQIMYGLFMMANANKGGNVK